MHFQLYLKSIFIIFGLVFLSSCKEEKNTKQEAQVVVNFKKEGTLTLHKEKSDSIIKTIDIEVADNAYETQTGLMYRQSMTEKQGMLFIFEDEKPRSFYMKNTEFSIDIIYINSDKEIVSIQKNAKPYDPTSLPSEGAAQYVLEVNAGLSDTWELEKGDVVAWNANN